MRQINHRDQIIFDISPTVSSKLSVFPGDVNYQRNVSLDFKHGHHLTLSSINSTLHIGAHADAPSHYHPKGEGIDQRSLHYYFGDCQVVHLNKLLGSENRVYPQDLEKEKIKILAPRVLFATHTFPDPHQWNYNFYGLSPELIEYLGEKGIILVGIDTPSVDPAESKNLETHQKIFEYDMAILEGIILNQVPDGLYTLIALPLKIKDGDASPVRAVLMQNEK